MSSTLLSLLGGGASALVLAILWLWEKSKRKGLQSDNERLESETKARDTVIKSLGRTLKDREGRLNEYRKKLVKADPLGVIDDFFGGVRGEGEDGS